MGLLGALQDKQFRFDVGNGLKDELNREIVGELLGAPVDIATMAMRPFGYKTALLGLMILNFLSVIPKTLLI